MPRILALAWLPGTAVLCCLSVADTYMGLLDPPLPPTAWTWTFLTLFVSWTLLVPVVGMTTAVRRRQRSAALLHGALLFAGIWSTYAAHGFIL